MKERQIRTEMRESEERMLFTPFRGSHIYTLPFNPLATSWVELSEERVTDDGISIQVVQLNVLNLVIMIRCTKFWLSSETSNSGTIITLHCQWRSKIDYFVLKMPWRWDWKYLPKFLVSIFNLRAKRVYVNTDSTDSLQ